MQLEYQLIWEGDPAFRSEEGYFKVKGGVAESALLTKLHLGLNPSQEKLCCCTETPHNSAEEFLESCDESISKYKAAVRLIIILRRTL